MNVGRRHEACEKRLGTPKRDRVEGVKEDVEWLRWRVGIQVGKDCIDNLGRRRRKFCSQSIGEGAGNCSEDGTGCQSGSIAVYNQDFGRRGGRVLAV